MADFNSKIKVSFIDDFSRGAKAAKARRGGLSSAAAGFDKAGPP